MLTCTEFLASLYALIPYGFVIWLDLNVRALLLAEMVLYQHYFCHKSWVQFTQNILCLIYRCFAHGSSSPFEEVIWLSLLILVFQSFNSTLTVAALRPHYLFAIDTWLLAKTLQSSFAICLWSFVSQIDQKNDKSSRVWYPFSERQMDSLSNLMSLLTPVTLLEEWFRNT